MAGAFDVSFKVEGKSFRKIQKLIRKTGPTGLRLAKNELTRQAALTLAEAQSRAPRDTGQLKKNVRVIAAKVIRNAIVAGKIVPSFIRAGFVFLQKYSEEQHENLTYRHQEGEAKYAENALKARRNAIVGGVARVLGRLGRRL